LIVSVVRNPHMGMPDADPLPVRADEAFPLLGDRVTIGRHSARRQITPDLSLDHDDGVSHRHVELSRTPEAGFSLADLGSSNGTTVNGTEVPAGTSVLLRDGDSIALGRWTKLTVRRTAVPAPGNGAGTLVDLPNAG
jgi:pSer/pThr/pTyr-binding forkhead associated (FHA) protein